MATIDIKRGTAVILTPTIDDTSRRENRLLGADYLSVSFLWDSFVELKIGDYIWFDKNQYILKETPKFVKTSEKKYLYTLRFEGAYYNYLEAKYMLEGEGEFSLSGTAEDFADLVTSNMNRVSDSAIYFKANAPDTVIKNLTFVNIFCFDAIQRICEEFELEFFFSDSGQRVNLTEKVGVVSGLSYKYHEGLRNITRDKVSSSQIITRLFAFGAEKNIDYTYGATRLKLPVATYPNGYAEQNTATYGRREGIKNFEDIYPHFTGTVTSSSSSTKVIDTSIDFNLNNYLIEGVVAKIVFLTGDLSGYEFEISSFDNTTKQVTFKEYVDVDAGITMPNESFTPSVGDEFTFVDIKMPESYITAAEEELETAALAYLAEVSSPSVIYTVECDWHHMQKTTTILRVGDTVTVQDDQLAADGIQTRIMEVSQSVANKYKFTIKIGDTVSIGYISRTANSISNLQRAIVESVNNLSRQMLYGRAVSLLSAVTGKRIEIDSATNSFKLFIEGMDSPCLIIDDDMFNGRPGMKLTSDNYGELGHFSLGGLLLEAYASSNLGHFNNSYSHPTQATRGLNARASRSLNGSTGEVVGMKGYASASSGTKPSQLAGGSFEGYGGGTKAIGVYGKATHGPENWAGYFDDGNVFIKGNIVAPNLPSGSESYQIGYNRTSGKFSYQTTPSDERLKENVKPITGAMDKLKQIDGCTFFFTKEAEELSGQKAGVIRAGLIAQQVQKVYPEAVHEIDDKGHLAVRDRELIGLLVEAVKELEIREGKLKDKVDKMIKVLWGSEDEFQYQY